MEGRSLCAQCNAYASSKNVEIAGPHIKLDQSMLCVWQVGGRNFTPAVIEPSFGIGRIMYCMFEHAFYTRQGEGNEARSVFK